MESPRETQIATASSEDTRNLREAVDCPSEAETALGKPNVALGTNPKAIECSESLREPWKALDGLREL